MVRLRFRSDVQCLFEEVTVEERQQCALMWLLLVRRLCVRTSRVCICDATRTDEPPEALTYPSDHIVLIVGQTASPQVPTLASGTY
jgi:hypothetical protein